MVEDINADRHVLTNKSQTKMEYWTKETALCSKALHINQGLKSLSCDL